MKLNKKRKTLFVAVLMFLFLSLLAGCGGKKTEEAGTERPEYIYVPEYFNLGNSDYIGSAINYENEVFYYTEAWDDETGKSRTGISLDVGEASVSAMQITPDGKIALLIYEWTNTEDENGEYQDGSGSYALWYMDPESGEITGQKELSEENGVAKDAYLGSFYHILGKCLQTISTHREITISLTAVTPVFMCFPGICKWLQLYPCPIISIRCLHQRMEKFM